MSKSLLGQILEVLQAGASSIISGVSWTSDNDGVDSSTNTLQNIDYAHHEIHAGSAYQVNITNTNINSTPLRIKIVVPAQEKRLHMLAFGVSSGESVFTITENPTGGATGGSSLTPINKRRDSSNVSSATLTQGVSAPTGGNVITLENHGFDKDKISGETRDQAEWILGKTGTSETYVFELESGTSDVVGNLLLAWYEHTDKN